MSIINYLISQNWIQSLLQRMEVYVVGGCVRDTILNKQVKDIDILVEEDSLDLIKSILKNYGKIDIVGESFSILKFKPYHGYEGEIYDISIPRTDRKIGKGHKGFEVITGVSILEDLKRRDFTINSIAINVRNNKIIDPFNGIEDLKKGLLRATDKTAFIEDPLRILRGIQFAARFSLNIETETLKLMKSNAHLIHDISGERILDEFNKILNKGGNTKIAFQLIHKSGLDQALFGVSFKNINFDSLNKLDLISFYYMLGILGNVSPSEFYSKKIKGEAHITKALFTIEKYFNDLHNKKNEEKFRWDIFMMLKASSLLKYVSIFPKEVYDIFKKMDNKEIPEKLGDIPISGNDLMTIFNIKEGKDLGQLIVQIYKDALMNRFDWKNKQIVINYVKNNYLN